MKDGKLTKFEKDWDLYLKSFTEWRNSDGLRKIGFTQWEAISKVPTKEYIQNSISDGKRDLYDLYVRETQQKELKIQNINKRVE
ncbi:MAG: hypothetical protein LBD99_02105 [Candidatus Margulisbacteria bacterium]|jgi:hypothetical protein|nr:hypothetical protein [Candidatus Margulisiibacteriota bacterium]